MNSFPLLIIRLYGILIFAVAILTLPSYFGEVLKLQDNRPIFLLLYWLPILVTLLLGSVLVLVPNRFVGIISAYDVKMPLTADANAIGGWIVVGIGIYVLVNALSDAAFHASNYFVSKSLVGQDFTIEAYNYPYFVATLIEFISAVLLIKYGRRISASQG